MRTLVCLGCLESFKVKNDEPDFAYCDICEEWINEVYIDEE